MEKITTIENRVVALENILGLSITIIDTSGVFHTNQGFANFSVIRQSHKKNLVCGIGFCKKCPAHCRYAVSKKCAKIQEAFVETCWKGITEIVVPLRQNGIHHGMLYAGSWKKKESLPPAGLPKKFYIAYDKLPFLAETRKIDELKSILTVFTTGILTILKELNAFEKVPYTRGNLILEFIKNHAMENFELSDIAAHLNLSCSRTSHLIRETLNKTFPQLLNEERLRRVKTLLVASNMTINEIATQTGFNDEYYLSRMFKRYIGKTPGQYKKHYTTIPKSLDSLI